MEAYTQMDTSHVDRHVMSQMHATVINNQGGEKRDHLGEMQITDLNTGMQTDTEIFAYFVSLTHKSRSTYTVCVAA